MIGNYAYFTDSSAGLQILDLTDPSQPKLLYAASRASYKASRGLQIVGDYTYTADPFGGVSTFRLDDLASPTPLSRLTVPSSTGLCVAGLFAYTTSLSDGVRIVDVSDPAKPSLIGHYQSTGSPHGLQVAGHYAYVASGTAGLEILDVTDPSQPVRVASYLFAGEAQDVRVAGNYAFVATDPGGLQVLDVRDPTRPSLAGGIDPGGADRVHVTGNYAYLTGNSLGFQIFDIRDPTQPFRVGRFSNLHPCLGFDVRGNYACVAQDSDIVVLQLRDGTAQTISWDLPANLPYTDSPLTLTATASSGLPVTFKVLVGPAEILGSDQLHLTGIGPIIIEAEQSGTADLLPAVVTRTLNSVHPNLTAWGDRRFTRATMVAALPEHITAVASGTHHCLVLDDQGAVTAWGRNVWGESNVPTAATNVVAIAAGAGHSLAVTHDGRVLAWGQNWFGQTDVPPAATNVVAVSAGYAHSVCLRADGTVLAWGTNDAQQLEVPILAADIVAIDCGYMHTLALRADGRVVSWGLNLDAYKQDFQRRLAIQLEQAVPDSATNVVSISAGWAHNLALRQDGSLIVWEDNSSGQSNVPASATNLVAVGAGFYHSLGLRADGTVVAWGRDVFGGVHDASSVAGAAAIAAGEDYSVAVLTSGAPAIGLPREEITVAAGGLAVLQVPVMASADVSFQWLHNGAPVPSATNGLLVVRNTSELDSGAYALTVSNRAGVSQSAPIQLTITPRPATLVEGGAWGDDTAGQCDLPANLSLPTAIAAGGFHGLALQPDGTVLGWGKNRDGQVSVPSTLTNAAAIAAGGDHSLALTKDGRVVAWGRNWDGQTNVPSSVTNVADIAAGWAHCLALRADGTVVAWGNNEYEQCTVPWDLSKVVRVAAGYYHSLALRADGRVVAWGETDPPPPDLPPAMAVAAGWQHSVALTKDGQVLAWGGNDYGETNVPPSVTNVVAIAAGYGFSLALRADRTIVAWGKNFYGETIVPDILTNVTAIAAGEDFSVALVERGLPRITRDPQAVYAIQNHDALLKTDVTGSSPIGYQWNYEGQPILGATNSFLFLDQIASTAAGRYSVTLINPLGQSETSSADLVVSPEPIVIPSISIASAQFDGGGVVMSVSVRGDSGTQLILETSTDLVDWTEVDRVTGEGADAPLTLMLASDPQFSYRFWRVRQAAAAP